ncbi:hypothetical protein A2V80_01325 [Candidatus Woesebacteria bacterium RBG_16_39_8b]|uniref:Uncharacterized protein n=1 Tax=Candidatus Woesebacteria bacterium RBG_16_39_8b TaxID=1802482 RepID=A0A1F7XHN9_9BACT|nr:MAG: hypothetical protein A2V80_01325 [Candidatus Woesebacteria bacterium RBG_16_39_8b]
MTNQTKEGEPQTLPERAVSKIYRNHMVHLEETYMKGPSSDLGSAKYDSMLWALLECATEMLNTMILGPENVLEGTEQRWTSAILAVEEKGDWGPMRVAILNDGIICGLDDPGNISTALVNLSNSLGINGDDSGDEITS